MLLALAALALQAAEAEADPIADLIAASTMQEVEAAEPIEVVRVGGFTEARCFGDFIEGAAVICRYAPGTEVQLGEVSMKADHDGWAVLGLPRRSPNEVVFEVRDEQGVLLDRRMQPIADREYDLQRVDGVPQSTVTPDPSTLPRRQREYAQKQAAFNSLWDGQGFLDGFIAPAEGRTTGVYGSARIYNGNGAERGVHWGLDWAAPMGTPVHAPAGGLVTLAEDDMYYEGGLIFIDHGQGLVSAFLHLSAVHVEEGQFVEQGELIGDIGAGGRSTGPHLDWRVKVRNAFYIDPQSLLDMDLE